jgi:RNA polymerase sigma factor (sigma-70 family)
MLPVNNSTALAGRTRRELVADAQSGTPVAAPALDLLLVEHEGLCRKVVSDVRKGESPLDEDLLQTARVAFVRAVEAFKPGGASLSSFAWAVMFRAVLNEAKRCRRDALRLPVADIEDNKRAVEDDRLSRQLESLVLRAALSTLPAADRDLLTRLYDKDESQTEVARQMGISHTTVQNRHRRAINNLRLALSA